MGISSDSLHNKNCYAYLKQLAEKIENLPESLKNSVKFSPIAKHFSSNGVLNSAFDANYPYGDLYTEIFSQLDQVSMVEFLNNALGESKGENLKKIQEFIHCLYANDNNILSETYKAIASLVEAQTPSGNSLEHDIETLLGSDSTPLINAVTPSLVNSKWTRFVNTFLSRNFKPQHTTSLATVRHYKYQEQGQGPVECRFGTQWQKQNGKDQISPLFELWLNVQKEMQPKKSHIYFNFLSYDRTDLEGKKEAMGSRVLHYLGERHDNLVMLTLPADKGLMDKRDYKKTQPCLNTQEVLQDFLAITQGSRERSSQKHQDFVLSEKLRASLFGETLEEEAFKQLFENSLVALQLKDNTLISLSQRQALWFHFVNYEIPKLLIDKLQPASINFSCKDAIDRGGVASAYYNLIASLQTNIPLSRAEFDEAVQAAPTMVKGRGMNEHIHRLWNTVDYYVRANFDSLIKDQKSSWLIQWRDMHCPHSRVKDVLQDSLAKHIQHLKSKLAAIPQDKALANEEEVVKKTAQINICLTCLESICQYRSYKVSGNRLLLEATARIAELATLDTPELQRQKIKAYQDLYKKIIHINNYSGSFLRIIGGALKFCLGSLLKLTLVGSQKGERAQNEGYATLMTGLNRRAGLELGKKMKSILEPQEKDSKGPSQ